MQRFDGLVIFDLDGTLVDSVLQIATILNRSRESLGYHALPISFYKESIGLPLEFLIKDLSLSENAKDLLISSFRTDLRRDICSGNNPLFSGVVDGLDFLNRHHIGVAIATSKPTQIALEVYKFSELSQFPIHVQGTDDFPHKPEPDVINLVLKKFPAVKAVMIGDRTEDITAAIGAAIPGIGIAAGSHSESQLSEVGAFKTFKTFKNFSQELTINSDFLDQILGQF